MAGVVPTMMGLQALFGRGADPTTAAFWFVMSMALLVGAIVAHPINWWLVRYHLKHGMMTVRPAAAPVAAMPEHGGHAMYTPKAAAAAGTMAAAHNGHTMRADDRAGSAAMPAMAMGNADKPRPAVDRRRVPMPIGTASD